MPISPETLVTGSGNWNLAQILDRVADRSPDTVAVRHREETMTYAELRDQSARVARGLVDDGLSEGDRLCLHLRNGLPFLLVAWGAARAGVVASPANPAYQSRELSYQLEHSDARMVVTHSDSVGTVEATVADLDRDITVIAAEPTDGDVPALDEFAGSEKLDPVSRGSDDTVFQPYTSGTTGDPKGVLLTNRNFRTQIAQNLRRMAFRDGPGHALLLLPMYHITGLLLMLSSISGEQPLHLTQPKAWDPEQVLEIIDEYPVTEFVGVATMFTDLLSAYEPGAYDVSSLEATQQGGTKIPPAMQADFEESFGVSVMEGYGLTETTAAALSSIDSSLGNRHGSAGQPTGHTRARIVDEDGNPVPTGETGELVLAGPHVMKGYYENEEKTRASFTDDGYFRTGDVAERDEDNYYYIKGRKSSTIITGGYNVYPAEVEDTLQEHPEIEDAVVFGLSHERKGETVAAAVEVTPDAGLEPDDVREFVLDRLAPYKHPRIVDIQTELPRTGSGKIERATLEERLQAEVDDD
jgi:long-chain acyl-CoA synthetase